MEIWKDIYNYDGLYAVSNYGKIKNCKRNLIRKLQKSKSGYLSVELNKNGVAKIFRVHRLVAYSFISKTIEENQINHINGIKTDNRVENLEWCTCSENHKHAYKIGLKSKKGEKHHMCKLKNNDIFLIRKMYKSGILQRNIANTFNVSRQHISAIINFKTWK